MSYIRQPGFWLAVIVVAVVINFAWNLLTKKGKLV
jgi:hypothetical protein